MNCEEAYRLLSGHLDGQNTPTEEAALLRHLEDCASCRAILQAYEAADLGLTQLEAEPPEALMTGVMARIRAEQGGIVKPKKRRFFFGPGTAIAAVAAVLLLVLGTGDLQNMQWGKTASSEAAGTMPAAMPAAMPPPQRSADAPAETFSLPKEASIDAPKPNANLAIAPADDRSIQTQEAETPIVMDSTPHLIITQNPEKPALETIAELTGLETTTDAAGTVWYVSDAQTARAIATAYQADYAMTHHLLGEEATDAAICLIRVQ